MSDGTVGSWGRNTNGQLGQTLIALPMSASVVAIPGLIGVVALSAGSGYWCAVVYDGSVRCIGQDNYNQLGDGAAAASSTVPVVVMGVAGAVSVSTGTLHACALLSSGSVACWGVNSQGALGDGTTTATSTTVDALCVADATQVAAGVTETCALRSGGTVECWGEPAFIEGPATHDPAHPSACDIVPGS
jgi:alpha-tubulin suppressor-like RCC1 family protein